MTLLNEIQAALIGSGTPLAPTFLKLRYLSSKLDVPALEEWIRLESEGYPEDAAVPSYRILPISYRGSFVGHGSQLNNIAIPPHVIRKCANESFNSYSYRDGVAALDALVKHGDEGLGINASNLMLLLTDKFYMNHTCIDVRGDIGAGAISQVEHSLRARLLEFCIALEKSAPATATISLGQKTPEGVSRESAFVTTITQNIIHGNASFVNSHGNNAIIEVQVAAGNLENLAEAARSIGLNASAALELTAIAASEDPVNGNIGVKAREWIAQATKSAGKGALKVASDVGTKLLTEALMQYYGLK